MNFRIASSCLALVLIAPPVSAATRLPAPIVRDHRDVPVVRDHRAPAARDHRAGAPGGGGVVITKTPGGNHRSSCQNNVCRDVHNRPPGAQ